jgi:glycyl-tRNA synthetase beta chain
MADFLLEIGLEEIPARMIASAEAELGERVGKLLAHERLSDSSTKITTYSTPRRLAVLAEGILAAQADTVEELVGPPQQVGYKDGQPTQAAIAFARKAGVNVSELGSKITEKGTYLCATVKRGGRAAADILAAEIPREALALYWAKNMYWRAGKPERSVRPVRWVVALLDAAVVPMEVAGIAAGNASRGHRVLHGEPPVVIASAAGYAEALRGAKVLVEVSQRMRVIRKALDAATRTIAGARWREDEALVETVVHLTEWPSVILGNFEPEYLDLPEEVLVTVMRDHQKYFAVEDAGGKLEPHFLAVLNTEVDEEGRAIIRHGNARVLRARFKDARFFWDFDQKTPLVERVEGLKNVTFQKELGTYYWKTQQNEAAVKGLAARARAGGANFDEASLIEANKLAKTDLTTELVKEFTELQGIIGGLYARAQKVNEAAAQAIQDQYIPASMEDAIPNTVEAQILGLADRIQTIVSMFDIGMAPTGSKDPFALRRAANAIVKILAESDLPLSIRDVLEAYSGRAFHGESNKSVFLPRDIDSDQTLSQVAEFFRERLHFYLKDVRGFAYDVVNAVVAAGADDVRDAIARAEALTAVRGSEDFAAISAAFKRIKNILRQAEEKKFVVGSAESIKLAPQAQELKDAAAFLAPRVAKLREERAYVPALTEIASLRPVVDTFFDKVMVLDPDPAVRGAHLGLIDEVLRGFSTIADFSEIVTS